MNLKNRKDSINYLKKFFPEKGKNGLEISPNLAPMVTKNEGWNVKYLDLVSTETLKERAQSKNIAMTSVPKIDYVYNPSHLISETVAPNKFDFVVSSHVIEHIPDLILHFQDIGNILNVGGVYCFIVPDMNLCFDIKKPQTSLGALIEAHINQHKQAPISAIIDEYRYGVKLNGQGAWSTEDIGTFTPKYDHITGRIKDLLAKPNELANWHGHIWRFTPSSFVSIYEDCYKLELIKLKLEHIQPTSKMEFLVVLQKAPLTSAPK